ncbi:uncharacterized protein LOC123200033 isoform X2 [Mangifera indica]|uniref:uncharacterized protein LOC123200033 isoform X2 n=1 Tax=Mangifera indica TaxID=29780 RepID=UPI001CFA81B0|nr:uncharacterized protein LOC123200033 isoform X2 [Mangifera indica]
MARIISQSVQRHLYVKSPPLILLPHTRHRSFKAQVIEIDLESSSSSPTSSGGDSEADRLAIKKLEEIVQSIIVQKATPDWLPFMPGWSFWVPPPRRPNTIVDWMSKLSNQLTEEEMLSLTTVRGWPCSSFLLEDVVKMDAKVEMLKEDGVHIEVKVEVLPDSEGTSQSKDED